MALNRVLVGVAVCSLVTAVGFGFSGVSTASTKPISKQSCRELVKTYVRVEHNLSSGASPQAQAKAAKDLEAILDRIAHFFGCPSKQRAKLPSPPTEPIDAPGERGATPEASAAYLQFLSDLAPPSLQRLTADELVAFGTRLCAGLDLGHSVTSETEIVIKALAAHGLSQRDAKDGALYILLAAADDSDFSFCIRHSLEANAYAG